MSAPPRKAASARSARGSRARPRALDIPPRPRTDDGGGSSTELVPGGGLPVRHHHDAEEAASAAAVGAALVGPFVIAAAIGLRVLRHFTRHAH